jgi:1-acyl-sn-glycerol-3-phosphate acyltransferase
MTQNINTTTPSDNPEPSSPQVQPAKRVKPEKVKPEKNLYQPYYIPMFMWRTIRFFVRLFFAIFFDVHVTGQHNVPEAGKIIIASNHLSGVDVPLIPAYLKRRVIYMAKEETFKSRWGWLIRFLGAFPVRRGEADRQSLRAAQEQLKAGRIVCIFPEGTRSKIHTLGQAHAGMGMIALRSGAPVLPVAIWGSEYSFKKFRPRIHLVFGQPVTLAPKGKKITREDIDDATEQVMLHITSMLPPRYRGVYAEKLAATESTAEDTSTDHRE